VVQDSSSSRVNVKSFAVSEVGKVSSLEAAPQKNLSNLRRSVRIKEWDEVDCGQKESECRVYVQK
jgi:hypothetical protein